jgi:hypothetical protein
MRAFLALLLLVPALAAPQSKTKTKTKSPTPTPTTPPPATDVCANPPAPTTPTPPQPNPPNVLTSNAWGRGFIDSADTVAGDYVDGYEYWQWAWALIYRPADNGTFCLTTYTQVAAPAAMVAYIADSNDAGSAALVAGTTTTRVGAACVKGVDGSCVDYWTQWGNLTLIGKETHCFACGDASHGPGAE